MSLKILNKLYLLLILLMIMSGLVYSKEKNVRINRMTGGCSGLINGQVSGGVSGSVRNNANLHFNLEDLSLIELRTQLIEVHPTDALVLTSHRATGKEGETLTLVMGSHKALGVLDKSFTIKMIPRIKKAQGIQISFDTTIKGWGMGKGIATSKSLVMTRNYEEIVVTLFENKRTNKRLVLKVTPVIKKIPGAVTYPQGKGGVFKFVNPTLLMNGEILSQEPGGSMATTGGGNLYLICYVREKGFYVLSLNKFDKSEKIGVINDRWIKFAAGRNKFEISSERQILDNNGKWIVYGKHQPNLKLSQLELNDKTKKIISKKIGLLKTDKSGFFVKQFYGYKVDPFKKFLPGMQIKGNGLGVETNFFKSSGNSNFSVTNFNIKPVKIIELGIKVRKGSGYIPLGISKYQLKNGELKKLSGIKIPPNPDINSMELEITPKIIKGKGVHFSVKSKINIKKQGFQQSQSQALIKNYESKVLDLFINKKTKKKLTVKLSPVIKEIAGAKVFPIESRKRLKISNGRYYLNGQLLIPGRSSSSASTSQKKGIIYLWISIKDKGAYFLSKQPFEGSSQVGVLNGSSMVFTFGKDEFKIKAQSQILTKKGKFMIYGRHIPDPKNYPDLFNYHKYSGTQTSFKNKTMVGIRAAGKKDKIFRKK